MRAYDGIEIACGMWVLCSPVNHLYIRERRAMAMKINQTQWKGNLFTNDWPRSSNDPLNAFMRLPGL